MSYIGNKPLTQAEKKTQQHTTTASKTIYPVSGGYTVGLIDVFLNGVLLLDNVDYSAGDGLNVNLFIATSANDTLVTVAWGAFATYAGGATGSFTAGSGETITVTNGIITGIV